MGSFLKTISLTRFALALVIALVLWGYIQLTQFPETTVPFQDVFLKVIPPPSGYMVVNSKVPQTIEVDVSGPTDTLRTLTRNNINATLDLSRYNNTTSDVKIEVAKIDGVNTIVPVPQAIAVQIEQQITKTLTVNYVSKGLPANYSTVGDATLNPDKVIITGPKSVVDQVDKANATLDISSFTSNTSSLTPVVLVDKTGYPIQDADLTVTPKSVEVTVPVYSQYTSKLVPVEVQTQGKPKDGFVVVSPQSNPAVVTIFGMPSVVSNTTFIKTKPVDITDASGTISATVDLEIPGGVVPSASQSQVTISFGALGTEREVIVPVEFKNMPSGYTLLPPSTSISLTLDGTRDALAALNLADIHPVVDLAGKSPGKLNNLPVVVSLPDSVHLKSSQQILISVLLVAPPTPTPTPRPTPTPTYIPIPPTYTPVPTPANTPTVAGSAPPPSVGASQGGTPTPTNRAAPSGVKTPTPTPAAVPTTPAAAVAIVRSTEGATPATTRQTGTPVANPPAADPTIMNPSVISTPETTSHSIPIVMPTSILTGS